MKRPIMQFSPDSDGGATQANIDAEQGDFLAGVAEQLDALPEAGEPSVEKREDADLPGSENPETDTDLDKQGEPALNLGKKAEDEVEESAEEGIVDEGKTKDEETKTDDAAKGSEQISGEEFKWENDAELPKEKVHGLDTEEISSLKDKATKFDAYLTLMDKSPLVQQVVDYVKNGGDGESFVDFAKQFVGKDLSQMSDDQVMKEYLETDLGMKGDQLSEAMDAWKDRDPIDRKEKVNDIISKRQGTLDMKLKELGQGNEAKMEIRNLHMTQAQNDLVEISRFIIGKQKYGMTVTKEMALKISKGVTDSYKGSFDTPLDVADQWSQSYFRLYKEDIIKTNAESLAAKRTDEALKEVTSGGSAKKNRPQTRSKQSGSAGLEASMSDFMKAQAE